MKINYISALAISLIITLTGKCQTQLFSENFESGGGTFDLNFGGPGINRGTNFWIVDTNYFAGGVYPNTTNEDSTYGGSIAFAPYSHYLHIYDVPSGYTNENYNPTNASDRFAFQWDPICTKQYDSVNISFYYMGQGSATAYGQLFYSTDQGVTWIAEPTHYNSKWKWQYATVYDPSFNNREFLQFGFRWVNNSGSGTDTSSMGIDDIFIYGNYDSAKYPLTGSLYTFYYDSCLSGGQDGFGFIDLGFQLSDTICDAVWNIYMSDATGNFTNPKFIWNLGIGPGYGDTTHGAFEFDFYNYVLPGKCYKYKLVETTFPYTVIYDSICYKFVDCPLNIITKQPAVTLDTNAVCAGSVIDVPFNSYGTPGVNNTYFAELIDSIGKTAVIDTVGNLVSNMEYSVAIMPGTVSGVIPLNVPPGCNYYIRIVSDTPHSNGTLWGPFCIQHCDILTNNQMNVQICDGSCFKDPQGQTDTLIFNIHQYDSLARYMNSNKFEVQLLNVMFFTAYNVVLSYTIDTTSGKIILHIPCDTELLNLGIKPGLYYMRIVATGSSFPDSAFGTVVHLTIGETSDSLALYLTYPYYRYPAEGTFCAGSLIGIEADPYRYMQPPYYSTYLWWQDSISVLTQWNYTGDGLGLILGSGNFAFVVVCEEVNNGCYGPPVATDSIRVLGPPDIAITGPASVCLGDTAIYSVPYSNNNYYKWTITGNAHSDTAFNVVKIHFSSLGKVELNIYTHDSCYADSNILTVNVISKPVPKITGDSILCFGQSTKLSSSGGVRYRWSNGKRTATITITPVGDSALTDTVYNAGCKALDSIKIKVNPLPVLTVSNDTTICLGSEVKLLANSPLALIINWSPTSGLSNDTGRHVSATPSSTTTYTISATGAGGCVSSANVTVSINNFTGNVSPLTDTIFAGQSVQLTASGGEFFSWQPSTGLNCTTCYNPTATPLATTTYTVHISDTNAHCTVIDSLTIDIKVECGYVYVPNAFSPDEQVNNMLFARSPCWAKADFSIFDRWGNKVFETNNLDNGWNGMYNGKAMNSATFVYYVKVTTKSGQTLETKGSVALVR